MLTFTQLLNSYHWETTQSVCNRFLFYSKCTGFTVYLPNLGLSAILGFTSDSAQCNRKSAICGLKIPSGQRSRSPSLTKRIAASGRPVRNSSHVRIYEVYIETWFMLTFTLAFVRYICRRNFLRNHSVMSSQKPAVLIDIVSDTIWPW